MRISKLPPLPGGVESVCAALAADPLAPEPAARLRDLLEREGDSLPGGVRTALGEVLAVLNGGAPWPEAVGPEWAAPAIGRALHEALVVHPREKQERHHRLASLLGRVLHALQGDEAARTIVRVTEQAAPETYPRLCRVAADCARALALETPPLHVARSEERLCAAFVDRRPFLCVHHSLAAGPPSLSPPSGSPYRNLQSPGSGSESPSTHSPRATHHSPWSDAALRFAIGRALDHVRGGHAALLQLTPERLEGLILDEVPFLIRTPLKAATRAVGWSRANVAARKVSELLPEQSRSRRAARAVGDLLPDKEQETVLPGIVHEWVRGWLQGVELTADRAGLLLSGSPVASCRALLALSPAAPELPHLEEVGLRQAAAPVTEANRPTAARLRELLTFALSKEYLSFRSPG